mgnify:FL=1
MGECLSDTIFLNKEIIVERVIVKEIQKKNKTINYLFFGFGGFILFYFIYKFWR